MLFAHKPEILKKAEDAGINRIVIDWEKRGKTERQHGYHLEQNFLGRNELISAKKSFSGKVICRVNPIHDQSEKEIGEAIDCGADMIMLPMFKTPDEVDRFLGIVSNEVGTILLLKIKKLCQMRTNLKKKI